MKTKAIRKLSMLLVVVMILSSFLMTTASAAYDTVQFNFVPLGFNAQTGLTNGTQFWIAVEYNSGSTGVCFTRFDMSWDASKVVYETGSITTNPGNRYPGKIPVGTTGVLNNLNAATGQLIANKAAATNWVFENDDLEDELLTVAAVAIFRFKVITDEPTNFTFTFNSTDANSAKAVGSDVLQTNNNNLMIPLNGGAPVVEPIVSLGAKVNQAQKGLRFGAEFNKKNLEVEQIGMLLYPTAKLGADTLDMNYYLANPYSAANQTGVVKVRAVGIAAADFVPGRAFGLYDKFTYFVTLLSIPDASLATDVTAVPFIEYADGSIVYGAPLVRNYSAVLIAADPIVG
ncbi:MAG: hypothetical protein CVU97_03435 [Firmicutes bacterium HGW-Firmicutes-21]|nr:MAG: hypothetical protein CVU97_03435 [Firmicutes bacterium HGW-Firmicutes-21]